MNKKVLIGVGLFLIGSLCFSQKILQIGERNAHYLDFGFSPRGTTIFVADDHTIKVFDTDSTYSIDTITDIHNQPITRLQISADSSLLITGGKDSTITIYSLAEQKIIDKFKHNSFISAIALSKDNKWLITGDASGAIKIRNLLEGSEVQSLKFYNDLVSSVEISTNNQFFLSASYEGKIMASPLEANNNEHYMIYNQTSVIRDIALSHDGTRLIAVNDLAKKIFWNISYPHFDRLNTVLYGFSWLVSVDYSPDAESFAYASLNGDIILETSVLIYKYEADGSIQKLAFKPHHNEYILLGIAIKDQGIKILPARIMDNKKK